MRRIFVFPILVLLGLAGVSRAGGLLCGCNTKCIEPPPPECPNCPCACEHRLPLTLFSSCHAQKFIDALHDGDCCDRVHAAKKLGCRLHADYCSDPCVLGALIGALQCDPCWEVRRTAAWSILGQKATSDEAILALYVSSKIDPHYMVRSRAAEALDILTLCRRECYKSLYESGDKLIKELKAAKWAPGGPNCRILFDGACAGCGIAFPPAAPPAMKMMGSAQLPPSGEAAPPEIVVEPATPLRTARPLPTRP
jgi:hypothetical protein